MGTSMIDCGQEASALLARLASPSRNRYFYGKLLDAYHLELEQRYGNGKRWLVNRLSLGTGVLCGLDVVVSTDGTRVRVASGVAIDGLGREIIVPQDSPAVDPSQPTDECGRPDGTPVRGAESVTLYICYHECEAEPVPALVTDCGSDSACENGLIRERYRLRIERGEPADPGLITPAQCTAIFAQPPQGVTRREVVCSTINVTCAPPDETCVALAVLDLDANGKVTAIRKCAFRRTLYSNAMLFDLIMCLASRVDQCCGGLAVRSIQIVSGNGQSGVAGQPLAQQLVVRVVDGGTPVANENVTFQPVAGDGDVGADINSLGATFTAVTDASGIAVCPVWQLGPTAGAQHATARIAAGTPSLVTFAAKAARPQLDLPVVRALWPTSSAVLDPQSADPVTRVWLTNFRASPRLEVTFNHQMNQPELGKPDNWLRVFLARPVGTDQVALVHVPLRYAGPAPLPVLGVAGFTEVFAFVTSASGGVSTNSLFNASASAGTSGNAFPLAVGATPSIGTPAAAQLEVRIIVLMRAESGNIVDVANPPQLLDAEFVGTKLTAVDRDTIWNGPTTQQLPRPIWDALVDTGERLPQSGDDVEGGQFHGWFALVF